MRSFWKNPQTKYQSKRVKEAGYSFQSQLERDLFQHLSLLEKAGEIEGLKCQASVYLTEARILYKPDFEFTENGITVWAEAKGIETDVWRIKRRLWMHYGPGKLMIYKRSGKTELRLVEEIIPSVRSVEGLDHEQE